MSSPIFSPSSRFSQGLKRIKTNYYTPEYWKTTLLRNIRRLYVLLLMLQQPCARWIWLFIKISEPDATIPCVLRKSIPAHFSNPTFIFLPFSPTVNLLRRPLQDITTFHNRRNKKRHLIPFVPFLACSYNDLKRQVSKIHRKCFACIVCDT